MTVALHATCAAPAWDEAARLAALERYAILDTGRDQAFDDVAVLAADLLDAPIAVVNFIASDRQWFKAELGIGTDTLPLDVSICQHAILQPGVFVVPDLTEDARFARNPLVDVAEGLRFYAGALLETPDGLPLGTVCVLDNKPRPAGISPRQERALQALASQTMAQLELRRSEAVARAEQARAAKRSRRLSLLAEASSSLMAAADPQAAVPELLALVADGLRLDVAFHYACQPGSLGLVAAIGLTPEQEKAAARIEYGQTICGLVAARREAMHVTGIQASDDPHASFLKELGLGTYFSAPLIASGELLGTLSFGRKGEPYSGGEIEALSTIVGQLATTLERCHVEARLRESESRHAFLLELSDELRTLRTPAGIMALAADRLGPRLGASRAFYAEISNGLMTVERDWARGVCSLVGEHSLDAFGPELLSVYQSGAVLTLVDVAADTRLSAQARAGLQDRQVGAFIDVVLFEEERGVGLLAVQSAMARAWTSAEEDLVREVAERVKVAIERVRAEAALRATEERLRLAVDNAEVGFWDVDMIHNILIWPARTKAMFGISADVPVTLQNFYDGLHPDDRPATSGAFAAAADPKRRALYDTEYRTVGKEDGVVRWVAAKGRGTFDEAGRCLRVAGTAVDITMRKAAEEALRASEAQLRMLNETLEGQVAERTAALRRYHDIVEATVAPICAFDTDYRLIAFNKAHNDEFRRVNGFDTSIGDVFPDLFLPEQGATMRANMARALAGESFTVVAAFGRPEFGTPCWEISYTPLRDEAGGVIGAFHHAIDISDRLRAEADLEAAQEALRQSQKMEAMGSLTGGVAHDFNNLLTPIVGSLDMLQRKGVGSEREQRLIAGAAQSAERAKTLVQRLLAFARRQPLQPVPVDLVRLIEGMVELVDSTSGPRVKVETETAADLPTVQADPNQLEMAILNLAVNARDAMPEGGRLSVSASPVGIPAGHRSGLTPGQYVRLVVADTGVGMDEATIRRAIEPFFSTKGIGKGTGLGLSMVHGLAAQLGGALTIQSKRGVGTSVELWLPVATEETPSLEKAEQGIVLAGRGTALLVDDEELVRASTAYMLSDLGYSVVEAASAEQALGLINDGLVPDLVVTDHLMPGMSGTDLALAISQECSTAKILVVSGYAEDEGIAADLPRLTKPFLQAELAAKLAAFG